jgi:hypothetical protein
LHGGRAALAAFVLTGLVAVSACGGDDDDAASRSRQGDASKASRSGSGSGSGGEAADTTATSAGGGGGGSSDKADEIGKMSFCDGFRAAIRLDSTTALAGVHQLDPPGEIADEWRVFLDFADSAMAEPSNADPDRKAAADAQEAATKVLDYVGRHCGYSVDIDTGAVTDDHGG